MFGCNASYPQDKSTHQSKHRQRPTQDPRESFQRVSVSVDATRASLTRKRDAQNANFGYPRS